MKIFSSPVAVWCGWVLARLAVIWFILRHPETAGDVWYYHFAIFGDNPQDMREYPQPGTWPAQVVAWVSGDNPQHFAVEFVLACLLADAAFTFLLLRARRSLPGACPAAWFWVLFGVAAGPVLLLRLDLFPALAVAGAAALLYSYPAAGAAVLAAATTMKLWPGVLAAGLVARAGAKTTWLRLASFLAAGAALCAVTVATAGLDRLLSPLTYQSDRGLQIESLAATPAMLRAHAGEPGYSIAYAASKSFEITGPGVAAAQHAADIALIATLVFAVLAAAYHFLLGRWSARSTVALWAALILLLIATNKVFSPQYMVWIGPLLAVALCRHAGPGPRGRRFFLAALSAGAVLSAGLSVLVFPVFYIPITQLASSPAGITACLVLAARNGLVAAVALVALGWFLYELLRFNAQGEARANRVR